MADEYAKAGVDEPREQAVLAKMLASFAKTHKRVGDGMVVSESSDFAGLVSLSDSLILAITTDGIGNKLLFAQENRKYQGLGQDLVANNVNDILCVGAEPIAIVDYIAVDVPDEFFLTEFAEGMTAAAIEAGVAVVGGEIAQVGEMFNEKFSSPRFELAATVVGLARPIYDESTDTDNGRWPRLLDTTQIYPGDILVGLPSSGLHSNGYSLARKILREHPDFTYDVIRDLLEPTRIYVKAVLPLLKRELIYGAANITGGGLLNIARLNEHRRFLVTSLPPRSAIFLRLAAGALEDTMFSTFNMGVGMVLVVPRENFPQVDTLLEQAGERPFILGHVDTGEAGVIIDDHQQNIRLASDGHRFEAF